MLNFKKIDFALLAITLTAIALGFILYELTAPIWDDEPPIPKFFMFKRLAWFPICEIICLTCFLFFYKIFNYPVLQNISKNLLLVFTAINISIVFCFIGKDFYELHNLNFTRYLNNSLFFLISISAINALTFACFAFFGILGFITEMIFNKKSTKLG